MTLATMADRALPLAERVEAYRWADYADGGYVAVRAALLADVAAAERLAAAADAESSARDARLDRLYAAPDPIRGAFTEDDEADSYAIHHEYEDALDAYRARKGVARG